ncbi:MAG TPA: cupin domain-containing protein [Nocardioidaceae bacterium]|nr:cupin domain-containing protein [Nocardioidaceae bacterium]
MDALALLSGDTQSFLDKVWASHVHVHHGEPDQFVGLLSVDDVDHLLTSTALRAPALRIAKDGDVLPSSRFTRPATLAGQPLTELVDGRKVLALFDDGASVVLQGLHRYWPPLTELVHELELALGHPCQANAYLTPPGSQGFAVHSDSHDVFVIQTFGTKLWELHDDAGTREVTLEPGISMYLPTGTPHAARAQDTASLHVTIGINQVSWRSVLQRVTEDLLQDQRYDGRLPAGYLEHPEPLRDRLAEQLRTMAAQLTDQEPAALADQQVHRFLTGRNPLLRGGLVDRLRLDRITDHTRLLRRPGSACQVTPQPERLRVLLGDRELLMPLRLTEPMLLVCERDNICAADLSTWLGPESRLVLVRRLVREGLLQVPD